MHVTLYLLFDLNEERMEGRTISRGAAMKVAENTMYNMVENHEDFDYYTIEDAEKFEGNVVEKVTISIGNHVGEVIKRCEKVRKYFDEYTNEELATLSDDGDFKFNCNRIGDYSGAMVNVYAIYDDDTYDGITTHTELENVLEGMNNAWVATVDAHW